MRLAQPSNHSPGTVRPRLAQKLICDPDCSPGIAASRRQFLVNLACLGLWTAIPRTGRGATSGLFTQVTFDDATGVLDRVQEQARKVNLGRLRVQESDSYVAIGNASEPFQATAVKLCEELASDFLKHFGDRNFAIRKPEKKMTLVLLSNPEDFATFLELKEPVDALRGIYEVGAGWLVICDNRENAGRRGERANSVALFHEATHQLCYESGLLGRRSSLPLAIIEGLGTYGEVRRPDGRVKVGAVNAERLAVLTTAARDGLSLLSLADLLGDDELLEAPRTEQMAYAQSWALVYMLMHPAWNARFKLYLEQAASTRDPKRRIEDASAVLGSLTTLESELKKQINRLIRRS